MSSTHHQHHHHPHLIPPPFPYSIGSGSGGGGGVGGGGGGRPSPNNTISTPTSASTLYTSPEDSTIVIPKTEHDDDDDEEASSPDSTKNSNRPPKKKQRRNKPTLSCQECVERKTKVSCLRTHFFFFFLMLLPPRPHGPSLLVLIHPCSGEREKKKECLLWSACDAFKYVTKQVCAASIVFLSAAARLPPTNGFLRPEFTEVQSNGPPVNV